MNKKLKIGLSILAFGVTATAGFLIYKRLKKKKAEKLISTTFTPERKDEIAANPTSVNNPPKIEEIAVVIANTPYTAILKNKSEGDDFRNWVNDNYSDYAKQIDLDRSGSYNNSFVEKAWKKYGAEYSQSNSRALQQVSALVNKASSKVVDTADNIFSPITDALLGKVQVPSTSGFTAENSALNLYNSMKGWGTNEKLFFSTLEPLNNIDKKATIEFYNKNYTNLETMVRSEFSGSDLKKALTLIKY
jgi:hypothetical protein|tara:strand:- start:6444 stop:7184 length:741 start_codon:yes stop_codon:yes gene_type:complete